jgi:hypothetical protein
MSTGSPKVIYLARRNPRLDRAAFVRRWRQHGALAMRLPIWRNMRRYAHCDPLPQSGQVPRTCGDYDGIGLVWYRSWSAFDGIAAAPSLREELLRDELEVFDGYVRSFALVTQETALLDRGSGPVKLFTFLHDIAASRPCIRHALEISTVLRLVRNDVVADDYAAQSRLPFRSVVETWFADMPAAESFLATSRGVDAAGDGSRLDILTSELVLYEDQSAANGAR